MGAGGRWGPMNDRSECARCGSADLRLIERPIAITHGSVLARLGVTRGGAANAVDRYLECLRCGKRQP